MLAAELIAFEHEVAKIFESGAIHAPVHLSGGNEERLIALFSEINRDDWVFSTYRSHYHALLHGVPREEVLMKIRDGHSMNLSFPRHRFFTSAMVAGCLPIAVGTALAIKRRQMSHRVWCFVGDMAASIGAFHDATRYAAGHRLPITFIVEDNGMSCDSPTHTCWGDGEMRNVERYGYERRWPHVNTGKMVNFV